MDLTSGITVIVKRNEPFTLYWGQPDVADRSHFTIPYKLAGKSGTIEGRLASDGTVNLSIRDGPLLGRSTAWLDDYKDPTR